MMRVIIVEILIQRASEPWPSEPLDLSGAYPDAIDATAEEVES